MENKYPLTLFYMYSTSDICLICVDDECVRQDVEFVKSWNVDAPALLYLDQVNCWAERHMKERHK